MPRDKRPDNRPPWLRQADRYQKLFGEPDSAEKWADLEPGEQRFVQCHLMLLHLQATAALYGLTYRAGQAMDSKLQDTVELLEAIAGAEDEDEDGDGDGDGEYFDPSTPAEPSQAEPAQAEPSQAEPAQAEPSQAEPSPKRPPRNRKKPTAPAQE
jgi:hypothetical protein